MRMKSDMMVKWICYNNIFYNLNHVEKISFHRTYCDFKINLVIRGSEKSFVVDLSEYKSSLEFINMFCDFLGDDTPIFYAS